MFKITTFTILFFIILIFIIGISPSIFDENKIINKAKAEEVYEMVDQDSSILTETEIKGINRVIDPPFYSEKAFKLGESLIFKIRYGFVTAGQAEMSVRAVEEWDGEKIYHIQTTARSSSGFDWIYKVRDEVNTFIDFVM